MALTLWAHDVQLPKCISYHKAIMLITEREHWKPKGKVRNDFQDKLKENINEIRSFKTYLFLRTSQQTCTKCQTQIATDF